MKNHTIQKLIYELVSNLFVFPIYKFLFKGHLIGRDNIPKKDSFIMVSNHGSLLDPPLLGHALGRNISFMAKAELFKIPSFPVISNYEPSLCSDPNELKIRFEKQMCNGVRW